MTDTRTPPRPHQDDASDSAFARTRDAAADAARRTAQGIEANPLGIVVGGLAVGVLAGALLPRSDKEKELLAPVGKRLSDTARSAISTAKEQGLAELGTLGLTRDAARDQVRNVLGGLGKAAAAAGTAAVTSARGKGADQRQD